MPRMSSRAVPWLRVATILLIGGFLSWGPIWVQVLRKPFAINRPWAMYSGAGLDTCDVDYYRIKPDGTRREVDRLRLLHGGKPWWALSHRELRLADEKQIRRDASLMCKKLQGEDPDLRVVARCATRRKWRPVLNGEVNLCAPEPPKVAR